MIERTVTRRRMLRTAGSAVVATGIAGCTGGSRGGSPDSLTLGTLNVFPMMQYFVIDQQGWYDDLGPDIKIETFGGGPPLVQAYASGELDFAYVGISPGLVAIANGVQSKVVAANVL
ncbi:MAG: ABC transporter substrate-binding protein, partial [Haloferacaceae archaeon]